MPQPSTGRRDVLARSAELIAAGALAGAAGCLSASGLTDTEGPQDSTDAPTDALTATAVAGFEHTDWLPAPSAISGGGHYPAGLLRPRELEPHADALGRSYFDEMVSTGGALERAGLDPAGASAHVASPTASVVDADLDADAVASSLGDAGFEASGSHEGFALWTADGEDEAYAVGEDVLVVGRGAGSRSPSGAVEAAVDAGVGAAERYVATSDAASRLHDRLDRGQLRTVLTRDPPEETDVERGQFAGNVGLGYAVTVDEPTSELHFVLVFASEADADAPAVRDWVDAGRSGGAFDRMDDASVAADGAAVVVSGTLSTGDLPETNVGNLFVPRDVEEHVRAGASVMVDDEADVVTVTWTSSQNADYVVATFDPEGGEPVEKRMDDVGDSVTYEGADGETVQVTVLGHAGDRSAVIFDRTAEL